MRTRGVGILTEERAAFCVISVNKEIPFAKTVIISPGKVRCLIENLYDDRNTFTQQSGQSFRAAVDTLNCCILIGICDR